MKTYKVQLQSKPDADWVDCDRATLSDEQLANMQGRIAEVNAIAEALELGATFRVVEADAADVATEQARG